ncbi:MAG: SIS domain-containing protein [Thermus sp.]|uniref:SIS domain-containing protein n=1 Tax=Thermus sp. TaxID=275 RepID=UPI00391C7174
MLEEIWESHAGWEQAVALAQATDWPWEGALFLGSGSSYHLAQVASWLARRRGFAAQALPSGEVALYPEVAGRPASVVGISRSGETTELLRAVEALGVPSLLLTTNPRARGREGFTEVVVLDRAQEAAIVQTRSFTSALVFFLAAFLGAEEVSSLPGLWGKEAPTLWEKALSWPRDGRYFLLGSGAGWGLAQEAALKLKETALVQVEAFHSLEFRHGPMSMVDQETTVFLLLPEEADPWEKGLGPELARLGARVVEVTYRLATLPLALVPFQFLAYQLAKERGLDPERPRHLSYAVRL